MNTGRCRRCGKSLAGRDGRARYCSDRCRRRLRGGPVLVTDTDVLLERRKLQAAGYACRRCTCPHPLGLVDEEGQVRCFKYGWPLSQPAPVMLPPGDFPAAA